MRFCLPLLIVLMSVVVRPQPAQAGGDDDLATFRTQFGAARIKGDGDAQTKWLGLLLESVKGKRVRAEDAFAAIQSYAADERNPGVVAAMVEALASLHDDAATVQIVRNLVSPHLDFFIESACPLLSFPNPHDKLPERNRAEENGKARLVCEAGAGALARLHYPESIECLLEFARRVQGAIQAQHTRGSLSRELDDEARRTLQLVETCLCQKIRDVSGQDSLD